ncbi:MAG: aminodeoxychorismate lyase [gamma proteobacterium symbiont of Phacoides pectinatus]
MLINGVPEERVSALDRGLLYGDGLFETLAVADGKPCLWRQHLERLRFGCERLRLAPPDPVLLDEEARREAEGHHRAVLKLTLTRGRGGRGYASEQARAATRIVQLTSWPGRDEAQCAAGVRVRLCRTRLGQNPALAGIKHLNRLEQVLARGEWSEPDISEGLMLDAAGRVIEGTMSNLFLVRDGRIFTPGLSRCGVSGVMRQQVLEACRALAIPLLERDIPLRDLWDSEALFLTNSLIGIWPVADLDGQPFDPDAIDRRLVEYVMERRFHSG